MTVTRIRLILLLAAAAVGPSLAPYLTSAQPGTRTGHRLRLAVGDRTTHPDEMRAFFVESERSPYRERGAVIQFDQLPSQEQRRALAERGVRLHDYLPDLAFIATVPSRLQQDDLTALGVRWVGTLRPEEKLAEVLLSSLTPAWCRDGAGLARFSIGIYPHVSLEDAAQWLAADYGAVLLGTARLNNSAGVGLPAENWEDLAADERVLWVEPFWPRKPHNNSNRANVGANTVQEAPYDLDGSGVMVGEWDVGQVDGSHLDFGGRVIAGDAAPISDHSTHVAGTVLGSGASLFGTYRGMAPGAEMISHQWWDFASELESETQSDIDDYDLDISQNSWGVGYYPINVPNCNAFLGNYFSECGALDDIARGDLGKPITIVWSAGNERLNHPDYCGSVGFTWGTIGPFATAKNVIAVGAINSNNSTMTDFSSWGPTDDGRLKPELVAPGCQTDLDYGVTSTKPGSGYATACGTSMSAPTVSGCVALWLERYQILNPGQVPLASTVKAVFVESADDLADPGPEYDFGYGGINVVAAVDRLDDEAYLESTITDQETAVWSFLNDGSLTDVSITLAWDDPGTFAGANPTLVNDLDLQVHPPAGESPATYFPWVLDPANPAALASNGEDHVNNLEQVRVSGPLPSGIWTVEVIGSHIPSGPQPFSLAYAAGIELSSGLPDFVVSVIAAADTVTIPGDLPVSFRVANEGLQNDTYDLVLSSARGWEVTPDPVSVSIAAQDDSILGFTLHIPPEAAPNVADTVQATAVSQGNPGVSASDAMVVSVISGRAVSVLVDIDTVGIPGKAVTTAFTVSNVGLVLDSIDWSVTDGAGWSILPPAGTVILDVGRDTTVDLTVTIDDPETIGLENTVDVSIVSRGDAAAADVGTGRIAVIDYPPQPIGVAPVDGAILGTATPVLEWSPLPHIPYPSGYDVFTYAVEIAEDDLFTLGAVRYDGIPDTVLLVPTALADGTHYWRVRTFNLFADSSDHSPPLAFETDTQAPATPVLLAPADGACEADTTPVFTWSEVTLKSPAAPVSYRWELSTDALFAADVDSVWTAASTYTLPDARALASCSTVVFWRVTVRDDAGNWSAPSAAFEYRTYKAGDLVFDCVLNVLDVVALVEHVFRGGALPDPPGRAETNCDPPVNVLDVMTLVNHVFRGGPLPCSPP